MVSAMKPFNGRIKTIGQYQAELLAHQAAADDDDEFKKQIAKASKMSRERKSQLHLKVGNKKEAEELASQSARAEGQVQPLANYVDILWRSGKEKEAVEQFKKLRNISAHIDIERAVFQRLAPVAKKLDLPKDWRVKFQPADDIGDRPSLDTLGPFRWSPSPATQMGSDRWPGQKTHPRGLHRPAGDRYFLPRQRLRALHRATRHLSPPRPTASSRPASISSPSAPTMSMACVRQFSKTRPARRSPSRSSPTPR